MGNTPFFQLKTALFPVIVLTILFLSYSSTSAQEQGGDAVLSDFLNVYNTSTGKAADLAGAIPEETYNWRPAEGIRSVKESVLHMAGGNYFFGSMIGAEIPEGIDPRSLEQADMTKEEAIAALEASVQYIRDALGSMSAEELDAKIDFFGNEITKRQAVFTLGDHCAEHLGQLIAYARMNGIAPPWSQ
ncbi:MAG: DinB family protein [Balneolaceae bacterium]|nr:DinB family protein [Balneolaceae bacterium]